MPSTKQVTSFQQTQWNLLELIDMQLLMCSVSIVSHSLHLRFWNPGKFPLRLLHQKKAPTSPKNIVFSQVSIKEFGTCGGLFWGTNWKIHTMPCQVYPWWSLHLKTCQCVIDWSLDATIVLGLALEFSVHPLKHSRTVAFPGPWTTWTRIMIGPFLNHSM